ncbi:MAG: glycosyltransferase [Candidatus Aphodocola sp.]
MKILMLGPYAPHGQVGAQRIISLSRFLVKNGNDVTVLCLSEETLKEMDKNGLTATIPNGVKVVSYNITNNCNSLMKKNFINERECKKALEKELKNNEYDIIFISVGPFYTMYSMKIARKNKIPYVLDYRDLHLSSPDKRKRKGFINKLKFLLSYPARFFQEYICIKNASKITVVSPEMKKNLCGYFHVGAEKVEVVFNGYDDYSLKNITRGKINKSIFYIGYFGKLMYYNKNFTIMLFNVLERLNKKGYKIKLMHIGPQSKEIEQFFSTKLKCKENIYEYVGQKDYKAGIELLTTCNAYYLEYEMPEGPGTKIFDYIFLNKPIIGVVKPKISLERLLNKFENAFVCYDEDDIEKAITKIIDKKIVVLANDEKNKVSKYSRDFQNKKVEKLLTSIVSGDSYEE